MLSVQMQKYFLSSDVTISSQFRRKNIFSVQRRNNIISIQIANIQKYFLSSFARISSHFRCNNIFSVHTQQRPTCSDRAINSEFRCNKIYSQFRCTNEDSCSLSNKYAIVSNEKIHRRKILNGVIYCK
jgi:hypothetical protein